MTNLNTQFIINNDSRPAPPAQPHGQLLASRSGSSQEGQTVHVGLHHVATAMTTAMLSLLRTSTTTALNDRSRIASASATRSSTRRHGVDGIATDDSPPDPGSKTATWRSSFAGAQLEGCTTTAQTFTPQGDNNFTAPLSGFFMAGRRSIPATNITNDPQLQFANTRTRTGDDRHMVELIPTSRRRARSPGVLPVPAAPRGEGRSAHTDRVGFTAPLRST